MKQLSAWNLILAVTGAPSAYFSDWFLTYDIKNSQVSFGYQSKDPKNEFNHACEGKWDFLGKTRGIQGWPLLLRLGTQYNYSNDLSIKTKVEFGHELYADCSTIHRLTPYLRLVCAKRLNLTNLCHEPSRSAYSFGTLLEVTL